MQQDIKHSILISLIALSAVLFFVFYNTPFTQTKITEPTTESHLNKTVHKLVVPSFTNQTLNAGISFNHRQGGEALAGLDESLGSGACAFDYNNDGWLDLFLIGGSGQTHHFGKQQWWQSKHGNRLYQNLGDATFKDVTEQAGLQDLESAGMGCAHADLDNDGDQELIVTTLHQNKLYRNNGDGSFTDISTEAGIIGDVWSTSIAIADYNHDGLLDIYIANYIQFNKRARTLERDKGFKPLLDPLFNASLFDAVPNQLFQNTGGLTFKEVANELGVDNPDGRSLSALWVDINNDTYPEIIVGNDTGSPSQIYTNTSGKFTATSDKLDINNNSGFQSLAITDLNNDGLVDVVAGTPSGQLIKIMENQSGVFSDKARDLNIHGTQYAPFSTWGLGVYDFNLDGTQDILAFNGLRTPDADAARLTVGQHANLWLNDNQQLMDSTLESGSSLSRNMPSRGAAFGDFDNDGDTDVLIMHNNAPARLLINGIQHQPWIGFRLLDTEHNRDAIGASVKLTTSTGSQFRQIIAGSGFLSDHDRRIQFGLGQHQDAVQLDITWSDGEKSSYTDLEPNHYHLIKRGDAAKIITADILPKTMPATSTLTIASKNKDFYSTYLQWLVESDSTQALQEIEYASTSNQKTLRTQAIKLLEKYTTNHQTLRILANSRNDTSALVRQTTAKTLAKYEDESTIYWLLNMLHDSDIGVKIETIKAFEHFFQEEEALINTKQLAIPHLITLLTDTSSKVRAAAARTLSESESYRPVIPISKLLMDEKPVKLQAIRALGSLRETNVETSVEEIAFNPDEAVQLRATALIALKRMRSDKVDTFIQSKLLSGQKITSKSALLLATLFNDKEADVINLEGTQKALLNWLSKQKKIHTDSLPVLHALQHLKTKQANKIFTTLLDHHNADIRYLAFKHILQHRPTIRLIHKTLKDSSKKIQLEGLLITQKNHIALSEKKLLGLLVHKETAAIASKLINKQLNKGLEKQLLALLQNKDLETYIRLHIINALSTHQTKTSANAIKAIIADTHADLGVRKLALHIQASHKKLNANLISLSYLAHDPLSQEALMILASQGDKNTIKRLWQQLQNKNTPESVKVLSAKILYTVESEKVLTVLQGNHR